MLLRYERTSWKDKWTKRLLRDNLTRTRASKGLDQHLHIRMTHFVFTHEGRQNIQNWVWLTVSGGRPQTDGCTIYRVQSWVKQLENVTGPRKHFPVLQQWPHRLKTWKQHKEPRTTGAAYDTEGTGGLCQEHFRSLVCEHVWLKP